MIARLSMVAIALIPAVARGGVATSFSSNPNWAQAGNGSNGNSFGYQTSAFAGGSPGEGGGRFTRSSFLRYYADAAIGVATIADPLSASGLLDVSAFNFPDFGPGLLLGFFDTDGSSAVGLLFNNTECGGLYVDLITRYSDGTEDRQSLSTSLTANVNRGWTFEWNPVTRLLSSSLTGSDAGSALISVNVAEKTATYDAFGLWSGPTSPFSGNRNRSDWFADIFIDDVQYQVGDVPEISSIAAWSIVLLIVSAAPTLRWLGRSRALRERF